MQSVLRNSGVAAGVSYDRKHYGKLNKNQKLTQKQNKQTKIIRNQIKPKGSAGVAQKVIRIQQLLFQEVDEPTQPGMVPRLGYVHWHELKHLFTTKKNPKKNGFYFSLEQLEICKKKL